MADCLKLRGWGLAVTKAHRCKPNQHSHGNPYSEQPSAEIRAAAQDVFLFLGSGPDLKSLPFPWLANCSASNSVAQAVFAQRLIALGAFLDVSVESL